MFNSSATGHGYQFGSMDILGPLFSSPTIDANQTMPEASTSSAKRSADVLEEGDVSIGGSVGDHDDSGEEEEDQPSTTKAGKKSKDGREVKARGSKACTACRKIKSRCIIPTGSPGVCERCSTSGSECIFLKSMRGRRPGTGKKARTVADIDKALTKMESAAGNVFNSALLGLPGTAQVSQPLAAQTTLVSAPPPPPPPVASIPSPAHSNLSGTQSHTSSRPEGKGPDSALNPLGLLAEASLVMTKGKEPAIQSKDGTAPIGVASSVYFQAAKDEVPVRKAALDMKRLPELVETKVLSIAEVDELFSLYFERMHRHYPILNPSIHTPATTQARSPLLFSCICAVASRYYTKRTDGVYKKCAAIAKKAAFASISRGWKAAENAQAFLLLSKWNQPSERFEEDMTFQYNSCAVALALDLNLSRRNVNGPPDDWTSDAKQVFFSEARNRERIWLMLYVSDRSLSVQTGKPYLISKEDAIIKGAKEWWRDADAHPRDQDLSAMVELHRITGRIIDVLYSEASSGGTSQPDCPVLIDMFHGLLTQWQDTWQPKERPPSTRLKSFDYYHSYYSLLLFSFGVQHCLDRDDEESSLALSIYVYRCFESASAVIKICEVWQQEGWLRYTIDPIFVSLTYASTFLLKLASPTFSHIIASTKILPLVESTATILEACAVDTRHTPALYASFLKALLRARKEQSLHTSQGPTRLGSPIQHDVTPAFPLSFWEAEQNVAGLNGIGHFAFSKDPTDALNGSAVDMLVSSSDFWENMLLPGFGGAQVSLSGGNGILQKTDFSDSFTYFLSRPSSPEPVSGHPWVW